MKQEDIDRDQLLDRIETLEKQIVDYSDIKKYNSSWLIVFIVVSCIALALGIFSLCRVLPRTHCLDFDYYGVIVGILSLLVAALLGWQIFQSVNFQSANRKFYAKINKEYKRKTIEISHIETRVAQDYQEVKFISENVEGINKNVISVQEDVMHMKNTVVGIQGDSVKIHSEMADVKDSMESQKFRSWDTLRMLISVATNVYIELDGIYPKDEYKVIIINNGLKCAWITLEAGRGIDKCDEELNNLLNVISNYNILKCSSEDREEQINTLKILKKIPNLKNYQSVEDQVRKILSIEDSIE